MNGDEGVSYKNVSSLAAILGVCITSIQEFSVKCGIHTCIYYTLFDGKLLYSPSPMTLLFN